MTTPFLGDNSTGNDSCYYKLCLSNRRIEQGLPADLSRSSASDVQIVLDEEIDLHKYLFFRSLAAEVALDDMSVSSIPLTFTQTEFIRAKLVMSVRVSHGNALVGEDLMGKRNETILSIPMKDFCTSSQQTTLRHLNDLIGGNTNRLLAFRYIECLADTDFFKGESFSEGDSTKLMTEEEIFLLIWYIECSLVTRLQLNKLLNTLLEVVQPLPQRSFATSGFSMNTAYEAKAIRNSSYLKAKEDREHVKHHLTRFEKFHGLHIPYIVGEEDQQTSLETGIYEYLSSYLKTNRYLQLEPSGGALKESSRQDLLSIRDTNLQMLRHGEVAARLLKIESTQGKSHPFSQIVRLDLDEAKKCNFHCRPDLFLVGESQFTLNFGSQTGYVLGQDHPICDSSPLVIGPLVGGQDLSSTTGKTVMKEKVILFSNDRLYSRVRPIAKVINVLTDVISNECSHPNMWLTGSKLSGLNLLATHCLNENDLYTDMIFRKDFTRRYYRVKQARNKLGTFRIILVDQSFRTVLFSRQTYVDFALCIRPANMSL